MLPIIPRPGAAWDTGVVAFDADACCCRLSVVSVTADSEDSDSPESVTIAAKNSLSISAMTNCQKLKNIP